MPNPIPTVLLLPFAAAALCLAAAPITLSPKTTIITTPLRPDGWPDYVAALNARYSKNVTPKNNGFVLWLQIVGTGEHVLAPVARTQTLKLLGIKDEPDPSNPLVSFHEYLTAQPGMTPADVDKAAAALDAAPQKFWTKDDYPALAQFLALQDANLKSAQQAVASEKWWMPRVGDSMVAVKLGPLSQLRDLVRLCCAQATLRAGQGDFPAFLSDIHAALQMAHHVENSPTLLERLLALAMDQQVYRTVSAVAGSGNLTTGQCADLTKMLTGELPSMAECLDVNERWMDLDCVRLLANRQANLIPGGQPAAPFDGIAFANVDWDIVLKRVNAEFDSLPPILNHDAIKKFHEDSKAAELRISYFFQPHQKSDWLKRPGETRDAYSNRVADALLRFLLPPAAKIAELRLRGVMQRQMARAILGLAALHAKTGHWPAHLHALVPAYLKQTPKDIYTPENYDVKYDQTKNGVRLYSVGPNGIDDAAAAGSDDIVLGVR